MSYTFNKEIAEESKRRRNYTFDDKTARASIERRQKSALEEQKKREEQQRLVNFQSDNKAMDFFLADKRPELQKVGARETLDYIKARNDYLENRERLMNLDYAAELQRADAKDKELSKLLSDLDDLKSQIVNLNTLKNRAESDRQYKEKAGWDVTHDIGLIEEYNTKIADLTTKEAQLLSSVDYDVLDKNTQQAIRDEIAAIRKDARKAEYYQTGKKLEDIALAAPDFETNNKYGEEVQALWNLGGFESYLEEELVQRSAKTSEFYEAMTEEERKIYGYYLAQKIGDERFKELGLDVIDYNGGNPVANAYLESISEDVEERIRRKILEEHKTDNEKLSFFATYGGYQFASGLGGLQDAIAGNEKYKPTPGVISAGAQFSEDLEGWRGVLYDVGSTTVNMAPSLLVGLANPTAGAVLMGTTAGGNAYTQMINEGGTWGQSVAYGTLVGTSEAVLERILGGIVGKEKFVSALMPKLKKAASRVALKIGEDVISEFSEEALQEILEPLFKAWVTNTDYEAPEFEDVMYSGLLGAITGGMFSGTSIGGATIADVVSQRLAQLELQTNTGENLLKGNTAQEDIKTLIDNANERGDKKLKKAADKVAKTEKDGVYTASAKKVGKLATLSEVDRQQLIADAVKYDNATKRNAIQKLEEGGFDKKTAEKTFETLMRDIASKEQSKELKKAMEKNANVKALYESLTDYYSEGAVADRIAKASAASPVTQVTERIQDARLKDSGIEVVEDTDTDAERDDAVSIESVDDYGMYTVKTESGNSVVYKGDEITTSNATHKKMSYASLFSANGAKAYFALAPNNAGYNYNSQFNEIYQQGITNESFTKIESDMPEDVQKAIYEAGKADREASIKRSEDAKQAAKEKESAFVKKQMGFKSNRVTVSDAALEVLKTAQENGKGEQHKSAIEVIEGLAKMLQVNINIVAADVDENGNIVGSNGQYNRRTNTFTFDITAGSKHITDITYSAMVKTAGHELTHFIQNWSPSKYIKLKNTTLNFLKKTKGEAWLETQIKAAMSDNAAIGQKLTIEQAKDEVVADAFANVLTEVDFAETVLRTDKGLFEKVHTWVNDNLKDFNKALKIATEEVGGDTAASDVLKQAGAEARALYQEWADAFATALENSTSQQTDVNGDVQLQVRGKNKYGIEVYETSEEIKKLPIKERQKIFLAIMSKEYRGRTAKFVRNGHAYYAQFDYRDINKNIYGDKLSDKKGWKAKINAGADGNIFELVENSTYNGSEVEKGKLNAAHKGVNHWDYFIKTVQIDNTVYDLVANVRKKSNEQFVYSIQLNQNKKIEASPSLDSPNGVLNRMLNASKDTIPQESTSVKENISDTQNQARSRERLDTEARYDIAQSVLKYVDTLSDSPQKAKLKANAIAYASEVDKYEIESDRYDTATINGWDEMAAVAYQGMTMAKMVIDQIETDSDFALTMADAVGTFEQYSESEKTKVRNEYKRKYENAIKSEKTKNEFLRNELRAAMRDISDSERKAKQFAQREKKANYRAKQIELRVQRDHYTSMLLKERTRLKNAIEKPTETASVPKDANEVAKGVISLINALNAFNGTSALTKSSAELVDMIMSIGEAEVRARKSKSVIARTAATDKVMLNATLAFRQVKQQIDSLLGEYKKLSPKYELKDGEKAPSAAASIVYNDIIHEALQDLSESFNTPEMVLERGLDFVYEGLKIVRALNHQLLNANQMYIKGKSVDVLKLRNRLYEDAKRSSAFLNKVLGNKFVSNVLTPKTMIHIAFGATENADTFYDMLNDGQTRYIRFLNGAKDIFAPVAREIENEKFKSDKPTLKTGLKYTDGTDVLLNYEFALSLIKIVENEDSLRHAVWGGLQIPDLEPYNKGEKKTAYNSKRMVEHARIVEETKTDEDVTKRIEDALSKGEELTNDDYLAMYAEQIAWNNRLSLATEIEAKYKKAAEMLKEQMSKTDVGKQALVMLSCMTKYYDQYARKYLNEATMELYGFEKTLKEGKTYYPIRVIKGQLDVSDNTDIVRDYSLESWGAMKHRMDSKKGIELYGALTELEAYMENTAKFYAWTNVTKNMKRILNTQIVEDNGEITSLVSKINQMYGTYDASKKYSLKNKFMSGFEQYMKDLQTEIVGANKSGNGELWAKMQGAFVTNALLLNISTPLVQFSALPLVAVDSGYISMLKSAVKDGRGKIPTLLSKAQKEYVAKYSEVYKYRSGGLISVDLVAAKQNKGVVSKALSSPGLAWTESADAQVLGKQFYALLDRVKRTHKGISAEEAARIAGRQLDETIYEFQANYTVLQRAPLMRGSGLSKLIFGTFRTQQITLLNAVVDSAVKTHSLTLQMKNAKKGSAEYEALHRKRNASHVRTVKIQAALAISNAFNAAIRMGVGLLRRKDDEEKMETAWYDFLDSYLTMFPLIGDIASFLIKQANDQSFYGDEAFGLGMLDVITEAIQSVADIYEMATNNKDDDNKKFVKESLNILALMGIPARNAYNIIKMLFGWAEDAADAAGFNWDIDADEW